MTSKVVIIILLLISFWIGYVNGQGNQKPVYGDSGFPKNCRALITDNLNGFWSGIYTESEALGSIGRNCGPHGLIWDER